MRSAYLRAVIFVFAVSGFLGVALTASAQTELIPFNSSGWKYLVRTNDIGTTTWKDPGYIDSSWSTGSGVFRYPSGEALTTGLPAGTTLAPLIYNCRFDGGGNNTNIYVQTVYFRTTFSFPTPTNNVLLTLSNVVDDGVVIYLNGKEVIRSNIPVGTVSWTTSAPNAVESTDAQARWAFSYSPTNLIQGMNTLAVELHNSGNNSSDFVFGLRLLYSQALPPVITNNPPSSLSAEAGTPVSLTVGASGTPPLSYQWRRDGANIASATNATYNFTAQINNAGTYTVVVTNAYGRVTNSGTVLTVFEDLTGPIVTEAYAEEGKLSIVIVRFADSSGGLFTTTAINTNNYVINPFGSTNRISITNAVRNGMEVQLRLNTNQPVLVLGNSYVLTVNNVRDSALNRTNVIAPNTRIPIGFRSTEEIFPTGQSWYFSDYAQDYGTSWLAPGFNPNDPTNFWGYAPAILYYAQDPGSLILCTGSLGTAMSIGPITYYYLTRFVITNVAPNARFELHSVVDDGAAYYLNGTEIGRVNMPNGPITYNTPAKMQIDDATCQTNVFGVTNLISGTNILAAEVHQGGTPFVDDFDSVFGAALVAVVQTDSDLPTEPTPRLNMVRSGNNVTMSWTNRSCALEFATEVTGALWREVQPDMANPYTTSVTNAVRKFWRLHRKQD